MARDRDLREFVDRGGEKWIEDRERHGPLREVDPVPPTVCLPVTVGTYSGAKEVCVHPMSNGTVDVDVSWKKYVNRDRETHFFTPEAARKLAYALLAAAGPEPVEVGHETGRSSDPSNESREPDPRDSSTWRRYVDKCGDEWFEISPGFVALGDRESLEYLVRFRLDVDGDPVLGSGPLADVQALYGLRPA